MINETPVPPRRLPSECNAVTRYEVLREEVLAPPIPARHGGFGLALLLGRGLVTWWRAVATVALPLRATPVAVTTGCVPPDLRREVATVLAGMALEHGGLA